MCYKMSKDGCPIPQIDKEQSYWYCPVKNAMTDKEDCRKCKYGKNVK